MDLNCPHFIHCSGCNRSCDLENPEVLEEARLFFAERGIANFKLNTGNLFGWRCRAKLAVRGTPFFPLIGLFEEKSHLVIDIPFCRVHHPAINRSVELLRKWIIANEISPYEESSGTGLLRYVQLTVERCSEKVQVVLVLNASSFNDLKNKEKLSLELLWNENNSNCHSLWINFNQRRDNVIFDSLWHHYAGVDVVWEGNACFHPASFMQANPEMFKLLTDHLGLLLPAEADVLELYAGVGAIGLALVDRCRSVKCVEIVPEAQICFEMSRERFPPALRERISFISSDAGAQLELLKSFSGVVIVDPPRKGLETSLLKVFCGELNAKHLIYISCGWKSFLRDCKAILQSGWKLASAESFLFFPGSEHLEVLAYFTKE